MAEQKEAHVPVGVYLAVVTALMVLLVLTVVAAFVDMDSWTNAHHLGVGWNTAIALTIAILKALLIALFFMHLRYSSHLMWVFAVAGVVWLMIMVVLTQTDYLSRNHPPGVSPRGEPKYILPSEYRQKLGG